MKVENPIISTRHIVSLACLIPFFLLKGGVSGGGSLQERDAEDIS